MNPCPPSQLQKNEDETRNLEGDLAEVSRQLQAALEEGSMKERSLKELQRDLGHSQGQCNELRAQAEQLSRQVATLSDASRDTRNALTEEVRKPGT